MENRNEDGSRRWNSDDIVLDFSGPFDIYSGFYYPGS
jgi:hypothetical protein